MTLRRAFITALLAITRSVRDLGDLVARYFAPGKAALLSVGEQIDTRSAAGRLVLNVLASVSQWEREAIGERTATAMQHKAASGEYTGGVPTYGFRVADDGVHLVAVEAEQAVLVAARELRAAGLSLRAVARELARARAAQPGRAAVLGEPDSEHGRMKRRRPVDLGAVRVARARLDTLVREHPELVGPGGDGVQGWVTTLERDEAMADTEQVAFRLPKSLIKGLDDYAARLAREQPGMTFTRTDVVRILLTRALDAEREPKGKPKRGRGGAAQ